MPGWRQVQLLTFQLFLELFLDEPSQGVHGGRLPLQGREGGITYLPHNSCSPRSLMTLESRRGTGNVEPFDLVQSSSHPVSPPFSLVNPSILLFDTVTSAALPLLSWTFSLQKPFPQC